MFKMKSRLTSVMILVCLTILSGVNTKRTSMKWDFTQDFQDDSQEIFDVMAGEDKIEETRDKDESDDYLDDLNDPCLDVHCGAGRECVEGQCLCVEVCDEERDPRRWVCSNNNETFLSNCHLHQARCLCEDGMKECIEKHRHAHVEYYGECRSIATCESEDLVDFPRRMREWLFSVMKDLAERNELSDHYKSMEVEAETDYNKRWSNAAVWKWCDLDSEPHDNAVSRHELFPLRAPLLSLEHCMGPFLDSCDKDDDHQLTPQEWSDCLELDYEILLTKCELIKS